MVVNFICWTITCAVYENSGESNTGAGYAQIPFIWVFGIFYSLAWSGLLVAYALEILPYRLRAKGLMIMNITVQAILAVGGQTNPVAWKRLPNHWNLALFYTVSTLCDNNTLRKNSADSSSAGSASSLSGCTSCTLRPGALLSRRSAGSLMAMMLLRISVWRRSRKRLRSAMSWMRRFPRLPRSASERLIAYTQQGLLRCLCNGWWKGTQIVDGRYRQLKYTKSAERVPL